MLMSFDGPLSVDSLCFKGSVPQGPCRKGRSIDSLCSDVHGAMIACAFKAPKWLH